MSKLRKIYGKSLKKRKPNGWLGNDLVFTKNSGEKIVFPHGSEAQQSWEKGLNVLKDLYYIYKKDELEKKRKESERISSQIEECDKKIFKKPRKRLEKFYNITQTAFILGVHRQSIYYWIKKRWLSPKRNYRNYPVFTVLDIEKLVEWRNTLKNSKI